MIIHDINRPSEQNLLTNEIIGAAIEVHKTLGPGLLESAYKETLAHELRLRGLKAETEVPISLCYKDLVVQSAYRADILVNNEIIIELKATENDNPLFAKQLLTYLKLTNKKLGLLINFNRERLIDGLKRIIN